MEVSLFPVVGQGLMCRVEIRRRYGPLHSRGRDPTVKVD